MLENFQLAAIVKDGGQVRLLQVLLSQGLQRELGATWREQYMEFLGEENEIEEIDFDPGYEPEEHERFCLRDYELPDWIEAENAETIADLESISDREELMGSIRGIVAFARHDRDEDVMLFQNFVPSRIIQPGRALFLSGDTYSGTSRPGLALDAKLSAVYLSGEDKLLFGNFRTVNTFLPLASFYQEASEEEIREILRHERLHAEDPDALASGANQWFRKRFAMLRESCVLDRFAAGDILSRSKGYDVEIEVIGDRIIVPAHRGAAKKVLQFLNEEIFRGSITNNLYETNSKRRASR